MRKTKFLVTFIAILALVLMLGTATAAVAAPAEYNEPEYVLDKDGELQDNGIENANDTGSNIGVENGSELGSVIKSTYMENGTAQRTHGDYKNNTNSCASCHQTHTGASKNLLFKDGVYNTCTACHDGTLGFYNVFEASNAGTFGGTSEGNMSVHLANGATTINAAPGGDMGNVSGRGNWTSEFNCASCHSAHGSYSERLLHYNSNGMGRLAKADGGIGVVEAQVYDFGALPTPNHAISPILVRGTAADFGLDVADGIPATAKVIRVYELDGASNSYVVSTKPWLYGYSYGDSTIKDYWTRFYLTATPDTTTITTAADGSKNYSNIIDLQDQNTNLKFVWNKGYVYSTGINLDGVKIGDVAQAYTVDLALEKIADFRGVPITQSNVNALWDGTLEGEGVKMSAYCASCHTDYLAHSSSLNPTGTFSSAYRHSTDDDSLTCVRCHYAHGTDVEVMMDANGNMIDDIVGILKAADATLTDDDATEVAKDYMKDRNSSSALKRYTNMAVCWGCHTDAKAEQLRNTDSYYNDNEEPQGLIDQPAMPGTVSNASGLLTEIVNRYQMIIE